MHTYSCSISLSLTISVFREVREGKYFVSNCRLSSFICGNRTVVGERRCVLYKGNSLLQFLEGICYYSKAARNILWRRLHTVFTNKILLLLIHTLFTMALILPLCFLQKVKKAVCSKYLIFESNLSLFV